MLPVDTSYACQMTITGSDSHMATVIVVLLSSRLPECFKQGLQQHVQPLQHSVHCQTDKS
jgi:hypothetical protein